MDLNSRTGSDTICRESSKSIFTGIRLRSSTFCRSQIKRIIPRREDGLRKKQIWTILMIWVVTILLLIWALSAYSGMEKWDRVAYTGMMNACCHLFLGLDNFGKFHDFHRSLKGICNGRGKIVFGVTFLVLGFVDWILIGIYYDLLNEDGPLALYVTLYVLYYMCLVLMFLNFMVF